MIHALVRGLFEALAEEKRKRHELRAVNFKAFLNSIFHHG
jgi:hypothetical protein